MDLLVKRTVEDEMEAAQKLLTAAKSAPPTFALNLILYALRRIANVEEILKWEELP